MRISTMPATSLLRWVWKGLVCGNISDNKYSLGAETTRMNPVAAGSYAKESSVGASFRRQ